MGQGLGRNSPVKLTLGKDNYCALIERHGQWIRWRIAQKCSCVNNASMQPDIHCKICAGRGFIYTYQKNQVCFESIMDHDSSGLLTVSETNKDCELIEVYDYDGNKFPDATKYGEFINLNASETLKKGTYYNVIMRKNIISSINNATAEKNTDGYYTVPGLYSQKANIDGVYYKAAGDIVSIEKITDAAGIEYTATEYRLNQFRIVPTVENTTDENGDNVQTEIPITEPVTVENVSFVPPFIFALLNQNLSKADAQMMVDYQGDAVLTYPYECDVSNDDVLTVLAGSYTNKEVMIRQDYKTDTLGVYFVYDIVSCTGIINGEVVEYKQGTDFILVENNKIKWLENGNYPDVGDTYSITYHVLPTYKVVKNIPQLRTSENQRFPKKAVVKLFTSYSENTGVNKQAIGRNGINGSY